MGDPLGQALDGGTASYVTIATTTSGTRVVLKLAMPAAIDG